MSKREKLSLYPLKFDDAVTALLKTKPQPKPKKAADKKKQSAKGSK